MLKNAVYDVCVCVYVYSHIPQTSGILRVTINRQVWHLKAEVMFSQMRLNGLFALHAMTNVFHTLKLPKQVN